MFRIVGFFLMWLCAGFFVANAKMLWDENTGHQLLEDYPYLQEHFAQKDKIPFFIGLGLEPIRLVQSKAGIGFSPFSMNWVPGPIDWQIMHLTLAYQFMGGAQDQNAWMFNVRTAFKLQFSPFFSAGPLVGFEFTRLPSVTAILTNGKLSTDSNPVSFKGFYYGVMFSEKIRLNKDYTLQISQVFYVQNYDTKNVYLNWFYYYDNDDYNLIPDKIKAGSVIAFEFSILY